MKQFLKLLIFTLFLCLILVTLTIAQNYQGSQYCQGCHSNPNFGGNQYPEWEKTLHSKIHLLPDNVSIRPLLSFENGDSISMGASYGNAKVYLSKVGSDFYARVGAGGNLYKIAFTYGWGWKQRYLVKIDTGYYMLPIQYNLNKYLDNSTGSWVAYNPGNWFTSTGAVKPFDNTFRTKSWDKNCMGCHVTGYKVNKVVVGNDTSWHGEWANNSSVRNMSIGCESCHGPSTGGFGIGHQMNPSKLTTKDAKIEVCGQCHNRASSWRGPGLVGTHEYPKDELTDTYFNPANPSRPLSEFMNFSTPPNQSGGPGTWPDMVTARQHHQQYQEYLGSKHYNNPYVEVTCFTCHTAHKPTPNEHQIVDSLMVSPKKFKVANDDNTLCLACHATHGPFADVQKYWIEDPITFKDSIGAVVNQHTKHNIYDPENVMNTGGIGKCSKCHMTKTAVTAKSYDIHSHTFTVIPPIVTRKYKDVTSPTQGMLNTCAASCHRNPTGIIPSFGIGTDPSLTNWTEATDLQLADTLWAYWQAWGFTGVKPTKTIPISYSLSQNFPNPFNPSTKIIVDIPNRSNISLTVYNIAGERIATLMEGVYEPSRYEVVWSGKDDFGIQVASGVYLYKLETSTYKETRKMLLVR